jgi:hypothetical protein
MKWPHRASRLPWSLAGRLGSVILGAVLAASILTEPDAQQAPRFLFGQRDFEMDWRDSTSGKHVRLRFLGSQRKLRIEPLDGSNQVMIRDLGSGEVFVLIEEGRQGVHGGKREPLGPFVPDGAGGLREIAGETCRELQAGRERYCLTDEGIPLELVSEREHFVAERLVRQAQPEALFNIPKDKAAKPIPGLTPLPAPPPQPAKPPPPARRAP